MLLIYNVNNEDFSFFIYVKLDLDFKPNYT